MCLPPILPFSGALFLHSALLHCSSLPFSPSSLLLSSLLPFFRALFLISLVSDLPLTHNGYDDSDVVKMRVRRRVKVTIDTVLGLRVEEEEGRSMREGEE